MFSDYNRIILMEDAMDCLISFTDFLYAFQVQFCYDGRTVEHKSLNKDPLIKETRLYFPIHVHDNNDKKLF